MKKIFIFNYYMHIGGAERALLGLLDAIDYSKYEVSLFLAMHEGELLRLIPRQVKLLPSYSRYEGYACPLKKILFTKNFIIGVARIIAKIKSFLFKKKGKGENCYASFQYIVREMLPFLPKITPDVCYDLAISFMAPHNIVIEKVNARKKIAWIHTDYSNIRINNDMEFSVWKKFDNIISISSDVTKSFVSVFPQLENKIIEVENIISGEFIKSQADIDDVSSEINPSTPVKLLSIGRFCEAKNYDNVPEICRQIIENLRYYYKGSFDTKSLKWYIIGGGVDEDLIKKKIKEFGMEENVILLGMKNNPYPYIKACDIYVQPSRYEGKSITVREAQILCKPVIVTNYSTSKSQVKSGVDGVIVPLDNQLCAGEIAKIIVDNKLRQTIIENLKELDFCCVRDVDKIYNLIAL